MTPGSPPPTLQVGEPAPDFALPDDKGRMVQLSELRGRRVVVYFFPRAMTPGWTIQADAFRDAKDELEAHNAVVLGISPDPAKDLARFREQEGLNFTLLSDVDHAVAERYGVWREKLLYGRPTMGVLRSQFVLDEAGRLVDVAYKIAPDQSVAAALAALGRAD